jgi:hypothetical protein
MWRTDALLCDCRGRWISGKEATDVRLDVGDTMKKWNARRKCGPHRTLHTPSRPPTAHPLPPPTRGGVAQSHHATRGDGALRIRTMPQRSAQRGALSKCWRRSGHRTELPDGTRTGRDGTGRRAVWPASASTCGCGPAGIGVAAASETAALQRVLRL